MKKTTKKLTLFLLGVVVALSIFSFGITAYANEVQYDYKLSLNKSQHMRINYEEGILCQFTPDEDGIYLFSSDAYNKDTVGVLYSADMTPVAQDDDSGDDENFLISHTLEAGQTYYLHIKFSDPDLTGYFYTKVIKSPVESIDVEPISLMVETSGYFAIDYDSQTGTYSPEYYCYEWQQFLKYTVNMTDGSQIEGSGTYFDYNGIQYDIDFANPQDYSNRWLAGNSYSPTISLMGVTQQVTVTVEETPIKSISVAPVAITEYTHGYYASDDSDAYRYIWSDFVNCTVTMKDGTVIENANYGFEYKGQWHDFRYSDNQNDENIWRVGDYYIAHIQVLGVSADVSVCIEPTKVATIVAKPLMLDEFTHGDYFYEPPKLLFEYTREYYYYQWFNYTEYTVTMKDGTVIDAKGCEFQYDDETYYIEWSDNQCYDNQWVSGEYIAQMSVQGVGCDVSVTILKQGLELNNGNLNFYINGQIVYNQWIAVTEGLWMYFGSDGNAVKNQWVRDSVGWCYLGNVGFMLTDCWVQDSVGWCYVGSDGYCVTDCWMQDSVGWCYLGSDGRMVTNTWVKDSVGWCYIGADGYCVTNCWVQDSVGWCYLDAVGRMVYDCWIEDSNGLCYIGTDGYWKP